ncbi:MAG: galactose oxidase-like domain-containing protein, partial [Terriglobales bacterium]
MTSRKYTTAVHAALLFVMVFGMLVLGAMGQTSPDVNGVWTTLGYTMPINPVHVALLHNGKILVIAGSGNCPASQAGCPTGPPYNAANQSGALILDPVSTNITQLSLNWDMFCSAMTALSDGRFLIAGGTLAYDPFLGSQKASIFDPATNVFTDVQNMAHGRWYPTLTLLSDGRVMVFTGFSETGSTNNAVEIYTVGTGWSTKYVAPWVPPLYTRHHLLPNGNVFVSGPQQTAMTFNPSNQAWTTNATTNYGGVRTYGGSVLLPLTPANNYDPRVMLFGGSTSGTTNTTEEIDLGSASPAWVWGPNMSQARIEMNSTMLPNGNIVALGGSSSDEVVSTASLNVDLFDPDPTVNNMISAGVMAYPRLYHSVALLLPDATVWVAGSNPLRGAWETHIESYQPPYLFTRDANNNVIPATRPTITSAPANITWGGQFSVTTPDAANISQAVLMRPGSSTHAFDFDQRLIGMSFTVGSGSLTVTAPPNSKIAPPGYYMLFLINNNGVPSVAPFLLLGASTNPAPTVTSITPTSGTTAGGTSVTITGTG